MKSDTGGIFMNALEKNRLIINEADDELVKLFEKRMHAVKEILAYKKENGLPVLDASREADNIARNCAKVQDEELKKYFRKWYEETMAVSRAYQEDLLERK